MRYILGEELTRKVKHDQRDEPLSEQQQTDIAELFAEARAREDLGVGAIWSPVAGAGKRPSSIYARGVWSLETAALDIQAVAQTQPRVKQPVQHIVISLGEAESATISDEDLIRAAERAIDGAGFRGHQAVFSIHRDTGNAHCHVAVASIHAHTLKAWDRMRGWNRLHAALRHVEIENGWEKEHGLAVVRDVGLPTQRVEPATKAERLAWAQARGLASERLEDRARTFLSDSDGLETPEHRHERILAAWQRMLTTADERGEKPLQADVYLIAADHAATIERGADGDLRLRLMDRADEGTVAREWTDDLGDTAQRTARWTPSEHFFPVRPEDVAPGPLDDGSPGTLTERAEQAAALRRRAWFAELADVEASEREVQDLLEVDPGRIARDIVAGGNATFTAEDFDRWTCSRLSEGGPEWTDYALRSDPTIVVRSADTELPLYTTRAQLKLETRVSERARRLADERDPLFDEAALSQAIADQEAAEAKTLPGFRFSDEQRAVFELLKYRFAVVQGDAGTGKSTIMAVQRRYCELTGRAIAGFATSQLAAETLGTKAKIKSVNSARALALEKARGHDMIAENSRAIIDETSMYSLEAADEMLERIESRSAGAVFIGDEAQLANIGAGDTMRVLAEVAKERGRYAEVTQVYRQAVGAETEWMREAIPLGGKAIRDADGPAMRAYVQEYIDRGHFVFHDNRRDEIGAKTKDLVDAYRRGLRPIAPGFRHTEAQFVNRAVRRELGQEGKGIVFKLGARLREFSVGDRVQFLKNAESKLGVLNGYVGDVVGVAPGRVDVALQSGRVVNVDTVKYPHLEWAWACTTHKSQGQGSELVIASLTTDDTARSAHVALTRTEAGLRVHTRMSPEDLVNHLSSHAALRPKDDALLFQEIVARTGGPNTPWARAVRAGLEHDANPLRQEHRAEMQRRTAARGRDVIDALERFREIGAGPLEEAGRREVLSDTDARDRRALEAIYKRHALESFVQWAVRHRRAIERDGQRLDRFRSTEEERQAQREKLARVAQKATEPQQPSRTRGR